MKRKFIGILAIIMILSTLAVTILSTATFADQQVSISLIPNPKVDIVLAKSRANTDVTNFESDILAALANKGVNIENVKVSSVEAQNVNMQDSFTWQQDLDSTIGNITITNNGQNVEMVGNQTLLGKNAIWIMPEEGQEQEFNFGYNISFGDSFNAGGMLLRVQRTENTLEGYMLSFNNTWKSVAGNSNGAIWKFTYEIGQNNTNITKELIQGINIATSGTLNVKVTDNDIKVSGGGLTSEVTCTLPEPYGNGFGFFSDHYGHNCNQIGSFALTNINLNTTIVKKFSEILRQPEWRNDAIKVLVNISDYTNNELDDSNSLAELTTRLINENIYFTGWGKDANRAQFENLISSNNDKGIFINNTNYNTSINETATYVKTLIDELVPNEDYVILGDPIRIGIDPPSAMDNTADSNYPYGKWKITHDFEYYENHIGQFSESGKYINNFINMFDKTGKYQILFEDKAVIPENIYVHRRPTAQFNIKRNGNNITLTSESYDLDSYSQGRNGISEEEWKYKKTSDTSWTTGKLTSITGSDDYIIQLRVKDFQNTWSNSATKYITNNPNALPVASFSLKNETITKYDQLEIIDGSYDPAGGTITGYKWEVYKESNKIYEGANPPTRYNTESTGLGNYNIYLTVTNARGKVSERYGRTFTVIEDTIAPEVIATPIESSWAKNVNISLEFIDQGGSGFKDYQYAITDSQATPSKWSLKIKKQTDTISLQEEGTYYVHIRATDNAGNTSDDRILGPYYIDNTPPEINVDYADKLAEKMIGSVNIGLEATDNLSGIDTFTVQTVGSSNSQPITNGTYEFTKNGKYKLVAVDYAGNRTTVNLTIKNVYYECEAGLEHPPYLSDLDECPVCKTYKGLAVTEETHIYDKHEHQVKYNNPLNAKIVEYYNGSKEKPEKVGSYNYELKVVYEGDEKETGVKQGEYKTGITGTYTITPKEITITDIAAQDKTYNGNTKIALSGGRLEGVCTGDEVRFEMAYFGEAESKNVGNWKIAIDEITLEGEDAENYTLKQPEYGGITANITQRGLSLDLEGKNKKYDGNSTVDIIKKKEIGLIEGDNIRIHIPEQGVAESENVGTWDVTISRIEIDGEDAGNYKLIQPEKGDIKVVISKEDGKLVIGCDSKVYDREEVEPYVVEKNSTSEVEYKYYKAGTNEQVEKPYDVGEYEVEGYIKTDGNYTETTSDRVSFEIQNPKEPILQVKTEIIEINGETLKGQESKKEEDEKVEDNTKVEYQDEVVMGIVVNNIGEGSGYAGKVKVKLPEGIELVKDNKTNEENGWQESKDGIIETTKLSIQNNINNEIYANTKDITNEEDVETQKTEKKEIKTQETEENKTKEETGNNKTLKLVLKVTNTEKEEKELVLETEIEQQNKRGDVIPYTEETKAYGKTEEKMNLNYIDLEVEKRIIEIIEKDTKTGKQRKYDIYQKPNEIVKLELTSKKIGNTELIVKYEIGITNEGNKEGRIEKITDILPQGITFEKADNPDWTIDNNGNVVNEKLKEEKISPNEIKKVELKLRWKVTENNLAARTNYAVVESEGELDQKLIQEEKIKLEKTNNYDSSEMLLSVQTGRTIALWITLAAISTGLLVSGIILIKKYVIKE